MYILFPILFHVLALILVVSIQNFLYTMDFLTIDLLNIFKILNTKNINIINTDLNNILESDFKKENTSVINNHPFSTASLVGLIIYFIIYIK